MQSSDHDDPPPTWQARTAEKGPGIRDARPDSALDCGPPIEWKDLNASVREKAIRTIARSGRLPRSEAEDLVVDAMVRLIRLRPTVRNPGALLTTAALNLLWEKLGRDKRAEPLPLVHESPDQESYGPPEPADERSTDTVDAIADEEDLKLQTARMLSAMERLRPEDRSLLHAYYFENRSPKAMDNEQSNRPGTTRERLHRARAQLRKALAQHGGKTGSSS